MRWLDGGQAAMMRALDHGPAHLPADLFAGPGERVLAGMKVHANTISHARLVALEETFPRTLALIGHDRFNAHSRLFLDQPGVTAQPLALIGAGFDGFLGAQGEDPGAADLARFEWVWLAAYHAADAAPLALADLAGIAPDALLAAMVVSHPAAAMLDCTALLQDLIGAEVAGLDEAAAILVTRPDADVLIAPASPLMAQMFALAERGGSIGDLLGLACEGPDDDEAMAADAAMQALVALIHAGALMRA